MRQRRASLRHLVSNARGVPDERALPAGLLAVAVRLLTSCQLVAESRFKRRSGLARERRAISLPWRVSRLLPQQRAGTIDVSGVLKWYAHEAKCSTTPHAGGRRIKVNLF